MSKFKTWISAFRLRTLPLAISTVLMGTALADHFYIADTPVLLLCLLTAVCLQVLSNLANDYGDFTKGTDNENRVGNMRALQSGQISSRAMVRMIVVFVVLSLAAGISLLYHVTEGQINYWFIAFFLLGLASIAAAIKYTIGKNAYGYNGLGDVFVFTFFGPVAVIGTYLLHTNFQFNWHKDWSIILPTAAIGLLCTGVLNTNNIRDIENDKASNKMTIPVKIGLKRARIYHWFLILAALILMVIYSSINFIHWVLLIYAIAFVPIIRQAVMVSKLEPSPKFNKLLKQLSLGTLLMVLLFICGEMIAKALQLLQAIDTYAK